LNSICAVVKFKGKYKFHCWVYGMSFFNEVYGSWKDKQLSKYEELVPKMKRCLGKSESVLDIGIGRAWLWKYLKEEGFGFKRIDGVDISREATEPELDGVNYVYIDGSSKDFNLSQELEIDGYDLVFAFDSVHLIDYEDELPGLVKDGGFLLQAVPLRFRKEIKIYREMEVVEQGEIGVEEIDRFVLQGKSD